jgi:thiol-disulfide isomerase/thioredoxin
LNKINDQFSLNINSTINQFSFNSTLLGNTTVNAAYDDKTGIVPFDLNCPNSSYHLAAKGSYAIKDSLSRLDATLTLQQSDFGLIQEFIGGVLTDLKGKKYKLSELKGKVVALNFWFVECKPCIMEMPELNELVEEFKGKEVVFLAIAVNDQKQLKKFLKTTDFNYKVIASGQSVSDSYGIKGFPTNIIIDQNGLIQYASTGIGPNNKANLQKEINKLLIK